MKRQDDQDEEDEGESSRTTTGRATSTADDERETETANEDEDEDGGSDNEEEEGDDDNDRPTQVLSDDLDSLTTFTVSLAPSPTVTEDPEDSPLPSAFDTTLSSEFQGQGEDDSCPSFMTSLLNSQAYLDCYPLSMMFWVRCPPTLGAFSQGCRRV